MTEIALQVDHLRIGFQQGKRIVPAVDGVSFELRRGEMLALLGESGSGKSMTALALLGLLPRPAGRLLGGHAWFDGKDLLALPEADLRPFRGHRIAMIFQEPMTALNPVLTVGQQIREVLAIHFGMHGDAADRRAAALLEEVDIPEPKARLRAYPHELSGGLRQRVMIAMALAGEPEVLIADEPTTALDVTVQAGILRLLLDLQKSRGTAILFITHNIALAAQGAQRCAVMYAGQLVECAPTDQLFRQPRHPYTRLLLQALPRAEARGNALARIAGTVPRNWDALPGCRFAPRCPFAQTECQAAAPAWHGDATTGVRCRRAGTLPTWNAATASTSVPTARQTSTPVLTARDIRVGFPVRQGWLKQRTRLLMAVDGVDLDIHAGETLALVGESGCGKSTLGKALLRLVKPVPGCRLEGKIALDGQPATLPALRRHVQMIFQDPFSSLDPRLMVGESIAEGLPLNHPHATAAERRACVGRLLTEVGLAPGDALRYPHQFSGGQRQRIGLARALAVEPRLIICDECTSALDVSVQAQILNLLRDIQARTGVAYLFITHDLSVVGYLADRVAVMYLGRIVEEGPATALFQTPAHPYTRALLEAAPRIGRPVSAPLSGDVPSPMDPPAGCPFHPRCPRATPQCAAAAPAWHDLGGGHRLRCHLPPA